MLNKSLSIELAMKTQLLEDGSAPPPKLSRLICFKSKKFMALNHISSSQRIYTIFHSKPPEIITLILDPFLFKKSYFNMFDLSREE